MKFTAPASGMVGGLFLLAAAMTTSCSFAFQPSLPAKSCRRRHHAASRNHPDLHNENNPRILSSLSMVASMAGAATIDTSELAQRDVPGMQQWAQNYGVQTAPGVEVTSSDGGMDWFLMTQQPIAAGSPVLFVPSQMVLSSSAIQAELGGGLTASEDMLRNLGVTNRLPLFRLMVKILVEYEKGQDSPYFPWLNAMPRRFFNGVAMTDACFECLPPYVSWLSQKERNNFSKFLNALRQGQAPLSQQTISDDALIKWAYNVALTRHNIVVAAQEKRIAPMADMLNHATNPNCEITYDAEGNCLVNANADIAAGSPLTITLGDPTNPSPLFATYGFLDTDCPGIFCKAMELEEEMKELGYGFKDLLIGTEGGEIAPQVWDLFLYKLLKQANDANLPLFAEACRNNNEETKQQYHQHYFQYTLDELKQHVNNILTTVDSLTMKANSYDLATHPRVPVIVAHNDLVKRTFQKVQAQLNAMG